MNQPFRSRTFQPIPAHLRPRRHRTAARVVILCEESVLLFADTDPGIPGSRWWSTPGGGVDPGETAAEAAVREVEEETGLVISVDALIGPIAVREVIHGFSDQILSQHEDFFVLACDSKFAPSWAGLTADEQLTLAGWDWLPLTDLTNQSHPVWPSNLARLARLTNEVPLWPLDLGVIEESTLPVGYGE